LTENMFGGDMGKDKISEPRRDSAEDGGIKEGAILPGAYTPFVHPWPFARPYERCRLYEDRGIGWMSAHTGGKRAKLG